MRLFVTGASGHMGSAVVPDLLAAGHTVVGLARSDASATALAGVGVEVRRGSLDDLDALREAGEFGRAAESDLRAVEAMGPALEGSGKPFVITPAREMGARPRGAARRPCRTPLLRGAEVTSH